MPSQSVEDFIREVDHNRNTRFDQVPTIFDVVSKPDLVAVKVAAVKLLKNRDLTFHAHDAQGNTPLTIAIMNLEYDLVLELLKDGANPNFRTLHRETPLQVAVRKRSTHMVLALLQARADINDYTSNNDTALASASLYGEVEMVEFLLRAGANMHIRNRDGQSAWQAAQLGSPEILAVFRQYYR